MNRTNCASCGSSEQDSMLNANGNCVPCEKVLAADPADGLPVEAAVKLTTMAESRHPTTCHEDAPNFRQVLEAEGFLPQ